MPRASWMVAAVLAAVLSGCVESADETPPQPSATDEGMDATLPDDDVMVEGEAMPEVMFEPVAMPFAVDGSAPAGVWVCGLPAPAPSCAFQVIQQGEFVQQVPHTAPVSAIDFTLTFTPATPNVVAMNVMVHGGPTGNTPPYFHGQGPSGMAVHVDLALNATDELIIMAWPAPDATVLGPVWVTPFVQEWRAEGTVTEMREA